ncbi:ACAT-related protein required for viability 1 [Anticarsia gemmatalis]|uniref:ACAT-related protein required for viability 1 n=1 Tax=Anticarsia gemmatalis TaxID=129554 RepID=UPI003F778235
MTVTQNYKCVNCGKAAAALFKTYGPTVLKLTKCESCKGIVDKYIEYDPVIVMIDLVLMSKEAQRHVLYNTEFKSFWKLLIILMMLETYGVWRNDSLFNIAVNSLCGFENVNSTDISIPINITIPDSWKSNCWAWEQVVKEDDSDLFIWEKDFYIQFLSILSGLLAFIISVQLLMKIATPRNEVPLLRVLKAFSLADVSILFTLPMLVWGAETSPDTRIVHYLLVFGYSFVVFLNVFTVLYECPLLVSIVILLIGNITKYATCYVTTPILRTLIS